MSSSSESLDDDAPARAAEPTDGVFLQLKTLYSFFKDPYGTLNRKSLAPEAIERWKAARALNIAIERSPNAFRLFWGELSHDQRERALELLLKYYCESRAGPNFDRRLVSVDRLRREIGYRRGPKGRRPLTSLELDPFRRLDTLLGLAMTMYGTPIVDREYYAFNRERDELVQARKKGINARPGGAAAAQALVEDLLARHDERLRTANAARVDRLEPIKAARALLHEPAALVAGPHSTAQYPAVEVYLSRLDHEQQASAVDRMREFLFAACEDRALRGEALEPQEQLDDIFAALHARDLGHKICAAHLTMVVRFYKQRNEPEAVVEHFQDLLDEFGGEEWTSRFPRLALTQQWYAAATVGYLVRCIHTLRIGQVVAQLATIFPLDSPGSASWAHSRPVRPSL
ncbi:hypothetical protein JCM9279_000347 [Rhodotorula babjevae]